MHKWYVLQVLSTHEKKVKKAILENRDSQGIGDQVSEVLLPTENVSEVKQGKRHVVEKRLWPGYLLAKMELNDQSWMYIKKTNGVIGFLGGEPPTPLSDQEVEEILKDLHKKQGEVTEKHAFEVGDSVKIVDGVFVNFIGTVIEIFPDKGLLSVMVSIFGRETRVDDLELWQVEEVTQESDAL